MKLTIKRIILIATGLVIAAGIIAGYLAGRGERAKEAAREAPIDAPGRMRATEGALGDEAAIVLDSIGGVRAGIVTDVLHGSTSAGSIRLTGELSVDPDRITTLQASVPGRLKAIGGHWPALGEHIAAATTIAQVSDALPLAVPRGGTVTRVSAQPGQLVQPGQELLQLTDFTQLLARVAWSPDAPRTPSTTITITPLVTPGIAASAAVTARLIGSAADVDSLTRLPVYLYRLSAAWPGARPGAPVQAILAEPGASASGVFVPASAIVQWEGLAWVYVQVRTDLASARSNTRSGAASRMPSSTRFVRRRVDTSDPVPGGWLVISPGALGVHAGDVVAVRGAQELLSEEFRSRASVGEDADKQ